LRCRFHNIGSRAVEDINVGERRPVAAIVDRGVTVFMQQF
jgi:hypothetical protein